MPTQWEYLRRWLGRAVGVAASFARRHLVEVAVLALATFAFVFLLEPPDVVAGEFRFVLYGLAALALLTVGALAISLILTPAIIERELRDAHARTEAAQKQALVNVEHERDELRQRLADKPRLSLTVTVVDAERRPVDLSTTAQEAWSTSELDRYRAAGERELARRRRSTPGLSLHFADTRSIEEYGQEVRGYVDAAREHWVDGLSARAAALSLAPLTVEVRNDGDRDVTAMVLKLIFPPGVRVEGDADYAAHVSRFPEAPDEYGYGFPVAPAAFTIPSPPPVEIEMSERINSVRFPSMHLFPSERRPLYPLLLTVSEDWAGQDMPVKWVATASGISRPIDGSFVVPISVAVALPADLLAEGSPS